MSIFTKLRTARNLLRYFGIQWIAFRLLYEVRRSSGWIRHKLPILNWENVPIEESSPLLQNPEEYRGYRRDQGPVFFFYPKLGNHSDYFQHWDSGEKDPNRLAQEISKGNFLFFGKDLMHLGLPPDWHRNPYSGTAAPREAHWSELDDFGFGDIKLIWELNRFSFVYTLVRAYRRSGDERYAEVFWKLVEDWRSNNRPQAGINWKCGQEISFRVMAWCFGLYGFLHSRATSAVRVAKLAQMIAISGHRIEANIDYALSQTNNHGISESLGLWTIGVLFPEFRRASYWLDIGEELLEKQAEELIYDDGAFSQYSLNYQRVMLHDYIWALRLGELNDKPFSANLIDRVAKAVNFLYQLQDEATGRLPNFGQNDGALVLPLSNCDYQDYRALLQAGHYLCHRTRLYPEGPWDEELLWMFGPEALQAPLARMEKKDLQAPSGGYYTLRGDESFALVHCGSYRHRPGQADMLHADFWWRGQNIAQDAGTYSYNAPNPWNNSLAHTICHNTVTVDGLDQMERVGKFLWLPWLMGRVMRWEAADKENVKYWEGEHDGYRRLKDPVSHGRSILQLPGEKWVVFDRLTGMEKHSYRLHWLLLDAAHEWDASRGMIALHTNAGPFFVQVGVSAAGWQASLVRGDSSSARGWRSPYYYYREPALSLALSVEAASCLFWSIFSPNEKVSLDFLRGYKKVDNIFKEFCPHG